MDQRTQRQPRDWDQHLSLLIREVLNDSEDGLSRSSLLVTMNKIYTLLEKKDEETLRSAASVRTKKAKLTLTHQLGELMEQFKEQDHPQLSASFQSFLYQWLENLSYKQSA